MLIRKKIINCIFLIINSIFFTSCYNEIEEFDNNLSGSWIITELNYNGKNYIDSLNYKRLSFDNNSVKNLTLPKTKEKYNYEFSNYSIFTENNSVIKMRDTFRIKLNSKNIIFNGTHKVEINKDYETWKKSLHIYSDKLNLKAESFDYERLKNKIENDIKPKSVIFP